jgi:hypothetical protein
MPVRTSAVCWPWLPEPTPQDHVGPGQAERHEEHFGHLFAIVLPGMHDPLVVTERRRGADHRRGLHEVRPRPEHVRDGCAHRILPFT